MSGSTSTGSVEASVPTDLTVTSEGDSEELAFNAAKSNSKEVHRLVSERTQLQQVVEKLRLELQGRDAQLAAAKAQYDSAASRSLLHAEAQKRDLQSKIVRIESELESSGEELRMIKERMAREIAHLMQKCLEFQQNQERLSSKQDEVKASLDDLPLTDGEEARLRSIPKDQLSLQQYVALRVFDAIKPLKVKIQEEINLKSSLSNTLSAKDRELEASQSESLRLKRNLDQITDKYTQFVSHCDDLKEQIKSDDFRVLNYDRIKRERDKYCSENAELQRQNSELELLCSSLKKEKEILAEKLTELKSKFRNQEQELHRYQSECNDVRVQLASSREDVQKHSLRLKSEREKSEDLHDKFLKARAEVVNLTDAMQDRLNEVASLKEKYKLSSSKESDLTANLVELTAKQESLVAEFENLESKSSREIQSLKTELSELRTSYNSVSKNYQFLLEDNSQLYVKCQEAKDDLHAVRIQKEKELMSAKTDAEESKRLLEKYRSLEEEYKATLTAFAASENTTNKPFKDIPGSYLLSEETLSLTRRVLQLERENLEACSTIQKLTDALDRLRIKISSYKSAISMAGVPTSRLLDRVASQEDQISSLQAALAATQSSKGILAEEMQELRRKLQHSLAKVDETRLQKEEYNHFQEELRKLQVSFGHIVEKARLKAKVNVLPRGITVTKTVPVK